LNWTDPTKCPDRVINLRSENSEVEQDMMAYFEDDDYDKFILRKEQD
jgi:hypothetical protein